MAGGARSLYMRASASPEGEPSAFWSGGPSNHQGRLGEEGGPGVKSKGWGALLMGCSHGFLGLPTKKLGHVAGGERPLYVRGFR